MNAVIVKSVKETKDLIKYVDAYILPVRDFSINYQNTFTIEEIKEIQLLGKEVFVMVNKNIHNNELESLERLLLELEPLKIKGIFFYDIAVLTLKNKHKLKTDLEQEIKPGDSVKFKMNLDRVYLFKPDGERIY